MFKTADPNYFAAAGIPLIAGRTFTTTDIRGAARVAIINKALAERLFGDHYPIGQRIAWTGEVLKFIPVSGEWRTVVGVVGDTRDAGLDTDPTPTVFQPIMQEEIFGASLVIRTSSNPASLQPSAVRAIREMFPRQIIEHVATLDEVRDATVAPRRLNALFITSFGALAMIIAMVGIAGVLAFSVSARTQEIGIRMSLGADAARVVRMVLGEGGVLLVAGLAAGVTIALLTSRLLRGLLFGVAPHDPVTLGAVAFLLAAVGVAACLLPALRAARVDPAIALRAE
jgi:predicted permease